MGAGPTGLSLALHLAELGLPVTLLETRPSLGGTFRGEALMPSGLAALEALELTPPAAEVKQLPLLGWSFWLETRPLFAVDEPMGSTHACTLVDPDGLVRHWGQRLGRIPWAHLEMGASVNGLIEAEGRIQGVHLASGASLAADLVVACDGRRSSLRQRAELSLDEESQPIDVLWFRLRGPAAEVLASQLEGRFHTLIGGEGSLALFASAGGGVQLGWPLPHGGKAEFSPAQWKERWLRLSPPALAEALANVPPEAIDGPLRLPVRVGLAPRWWRPGLLLLGDAAHPMSPVRAQGTSMALRDVWTAASVLPAALRCPGGAERDTALDRALAAIEATRLPEIRRIQALQQREWQRGERLGHSALLRTLLAGLAPGIAPLLGTIWQHSQNELRQGLTNASATAPP